MPPDAPPVNSQTSTSAPADCGQIASTGNLLFFEDWQTFNGDYDFERLNYLDSSLFFDNDPIMNDWTDLSILQTTHKQPSDIAHPAASPSLNSDDFSESNPGHHFINAVSTGENSTYSDHPTFPSGGSLSIPTLASTSSKSNIATHSNSRTPATSSPSSADTFSGGKRVKQQRNTEAARRYRQRKVDRVSDLEDALQKMTQERDELKLKLARAEAESDVLRGMMGHRC